MKLVEWHIEGLVEWHQDDAEGLADDLLTDLTSWAQERSCGIGGGFKADGSRTKYEFGLCAAGDRRLISNAVVHQFVAYAEHAAALKSAVGATFTYRPFTEAEADPEVLNDLVTLAGRRMRPN
jgi:hypothetical protein